MPLQAGQHFEFIRRQVVLRRKYVLAIAVVSALHASSSGAAFGRTRICAEATFAIKSKARVNELPRTMIASVARG